MDDIGVELGKGALDGPLRGGRDTYVGVAGEGQGGQRDHPMSLVLVGGLGVARGDDQGLMSMGAQMLQDTQDRVRDAVHLWQERLRNNRNSHTLDGNCSR